MDFPSKIIFLTKHQARLNLRKNLTPEQAYPKIKHFCSYRERCHSETREKLFGMGLFSKDVDALLVRLIEEGYLNEERFAIQFAGGHFRQKKWGKVKIVYELRQKKISEANIKKALGALKDEDYPGSLRKLAIAKWESLKREQYLNRQAKTIAYLARKGYELPLIQETIKEIRSGRTE